MKRFNKLLCELRATTSSNEKKTILAKYGDCKEQLKYMLNPFQMFNLTSGAIKHSTCAKGQTVESWTDTKAILDKLCMRKITGNEAVSTVNNFLNGTSQEMFDLFCCFIDKDPKSGIGKTLVNKVFKKCVPTFDVQLCYKLDDLSDLPFGNTHVSRKLDGVRCIAIKHGDGFRFFSRKGKEFHTLANLKNELEAAFKDEYNIVLDGELCIVDDKGDENFTAIVTEVKRKDHTIKHPKLFIIDKLSITEFEMRKGKERFENEYKELSRISASYPCFGIVEQTKISSIEELAVLVKKAKTRGWEGLIVRDGDAVYQGRRTKDILKIKEFHDAEFTVVDTYDGEKSFTGMMGGLVIEGEYEGKKVHARCGSGFTHDDRRKYQKIRPDLVNRVVTIQFFEVSQSKDGTYSLRFPVFKGFRDYE